ncbi:hypothetical protein TorRG33x02_061160 [Trema orientale]|uniref:Uncharacterized protein n=1 Tax=Trema orientale TaxID=63057 RepID=A0A2P5FJS6_TREOI|nr:hypothetical protein TorRG33x02_061160 [Trema orientale]
MAPKKPQNIVAYSGYCEAVPSSKQVSTYSSSSSGNRGRLMKDSTEFQIATKTIVKSDKGKASTTFKERNYSGEFVDKSTGRLGYKQEKTYCRTEIYDNKEDGYTHEYQTQVKLKHVAYPTKGTTGFYSRNNQITYDNSYDSDDDYY